MATSAQRAILALLVCVAFADGDFDVEEFKVLSRRIPDHPLFEGLSEGAIHNTCLSLVDELNRSSGTALVERYAREIPPTVALQAYKLALDMMYADGVVDRNEGLLVVRIRHLLNISDADFEEAVDRAKRRAEY